MAHKKIIRLTEQDLHKIVKESIDMLLNEYDEHILDGIDNIDALSINKIIKDLIPLGNRFSINNPYKPIRQLVIYFSENGPRRHGTRLTKDVVNSILKNNNVRIAVDELTKRDSNIISYIYGDKKLTGKPLMQRIIWELDGILETLLRLNQEYEKTNSSNWYGHTDAIKGRDDKRMVGLGDLMYNALIGANKIKGQIKKMQNLLDKPKNPFSYSLRR